MPRSIPHPLFNHESLESPPAPGDNHPVSEEPTQNLPQDGVERILARLDALEDKVERRLQDTRPIWEQVLARLDGIDSRLDSIESRLDSVERRLESLESRVTALEVEMRTLREEVRSSLQQFELQVEVLTRDVRDVRAKQLDLDRRLARLEEKPTP